MDRFEEVKLRVKDSADIIALVEEYVPLKARGRYHVGLCPFHQEKTPSFTVYGDSQHFKCYGCGEAGDVFSFLMKRDGYSFREALETLADRHGISTEGVFSGSRQQSRRREDVYGILAQARDWFHQQLLDPEIGADARAYLEARGLSEAIESFQLGFHPDGGRFRAFVRSANLSSEELEQAGLLKADGYERFAGRLMFPIEDERRRVTGFGGRVLSGSTEKAKYLNSPESPFFNKRRLLFGLPQVKKAGVRQLVVMEGYTDVIAAHLAGFQGAVATLGTALTTDHARLLERYATEGAILVFDGDRAGRQAADRAFRELTHTRLPVRVALLEEGTDPADLVVARPDRDEEDLAKGREQFEVMLNRADDALTVWFRLIHQRVDLTMDVHVQRVVAECASILAGIEDGTRRHALGREMAKHLAMPENVFLRTVNKTRARRMPVEQVEVPAAEDATPDEPFDSSAAWEDAAPREGGNGVPPGPPPGPLADTDIDLLACLLAGPDLLPQVGADEVTQPEVRHLLQYFRDGVAQGSCSKEQIVGYLFMRCAERPPLSKCLADCLDRSAHIKNPTDSLNLLLKDRSAHTSRTQAQHIRLRLQQARAAGDRVLVDKLTQDYLQELRSRSVGQQ